MFYYGQPPSSTRTCVHERPVPCPSSESLLYLAIFACLTFQALTSVLACSSSLITLKEATPSPSLVGNIAGLAASIRLALLHSAAVCPKWVLVSGSRGRHVGLVALTCSLGFFRSSFKIDTRIVEPQCGFIWRQLDEKGRITRWTVLKRVVSEGEAGLQFLCAYTLLLHHCTGSRFVDVLPL